MKTYLRLLRFAKPGLSFFVPYFTMTALSSILGVATFAMLMPLLDVLFNNMPATVTEVPLTWDDFEFSSTFLKAYVYQEFGRIIAEKGRLDALMVLCGLTVGSSFFGNIFRYLSRRMSEHLRSRTVYRIREALFDRVASLHIGYFTDQHRSDVISRATNDVVAVEASITQTITTFVREPISLLVVFAMLFSLSAEMTFFTLLILPVSGVVISFIAKKLKKHSKGTQETASRLLGVLDETLIGMRVVKSFNAEGYVKDKFRQENRGYVRSYNRMANRRELASPYSEMMGIVFVAIILYYGGIQVLSDNPTLTASQFITFIALFTQALNPSKAISAAIGNMQRGLIAGERILEIMDEVPAIRDKEDCKQLDSFEQGITFKNVRFSYGDNEVLKGIDLSIPKEKKVALVGPSGGGKSTIADLIPRFYDPASGSVEIDGHDIRDYSLDSLRQHMGVVTQESILFNDTIFNNIAFGTPDATMEDVVQAAKIANAHEFIEQAEDGYHTVIGDRGSKLSGGQRQRLSIARAVLKNPSILLLDEATSALDTESEKLVQDAIGHLMENRTALVIAHRLSTIQDADEILVISKGQVVERGSHQELMQNDRGVYRKLQEMQSLS